MKAYRITDRDILLEGKKDDYLLYAMNLTPTIYEVKIAKVVNANTRFPQFAKECYSNTIFCASSSYMEDFLREVIEILGERSIDLDDPVGLVAAVGGIASSEPLPHPERS